LYKNNSYFEIFVYLPPTKLKNLYKMEKMST